MNKDCVSVILDYLNSPLYYAELRRVLFSRKTSYNWYHYAIVQGPLRTLVSVKWSARPERRHNEYIYLYEPSPRDDFRRQIRVEGPWKSMN
jgi:hypothetical protein